MLCGYRGVLTFSVNIDGGEVRDEHVDIHPREGIGFDGTLEGIAAVFSFPLFCLACLTVSHNGGGNGVRGGVAVADRISCCFGTLSMQLLNDVCEVCIIQRYDAPVLWWK